MTRVDARGLGCPQPLLMALEALKKEKGQLTIVVDSESALESIERALRREKRAVQVTRSGEEVSIAIGPTTA
ncbi:MAG: sulfurtransferase TusA family protein [Deltaproteobacteria bacterium]|jgi:TusA-related sulfurtransferase|nr:sulfurtransferase TusA family protein [Deltaproteobacteria bacterium]